ncbi:Ca2+ transporting ATPase, sarcoplasmic/endoplasmic reticulum [Strigomonas culicis]|uniref:Ca2+ transporting ATPase, sarcoplasmic/endoplasmic reticulum n=1 Tax=Strigomonas culicis TaxID=28005 RepID=S9TPN2_9TRYP|nr:Ca2+ transporting ATPase, sarcoplasmic/endoplasmic reticulum [Strigomonas culicis]|eukprot:EPY20262.1 Ca2+ transporting ATPase, sarcoplasmic/endoplasmic reticulum [Strigomonas culicis]
MKTLLYLTVVSLALATTAFVHYHFVFISLLCIAQWEKHIVADNSFKCSIEIAQKLGACKTVCIQDEGNLLLYGEMLSFTVITFEKNGQPSIYEWAKSFAHETDPHKKNGNSLTKDAVQNDEKLEMLLTILVLFRNAFTRAPSFDSPPTMQTYGTAFFLLGEIVNQLLSQTTASHHFLSTFAHEKENMWARERLLSFESGTTGLLIRSVGCHTSLCLLVGGEPESVLTGCSRIMVENGQVKELDSDLREVIKSRVEAMRQHYRVQCVALAFKPVRNTRSECDEKLLTLVGLCGVSHAPHPHDAHQVEKLHKNDISVKAVATDFKRVASEESSVSPIVHGVLVRKRMRVDCRQQDGVELQEIGDGVVISCEQLESAVHAVLASRALLANLKLLYRFLLRSGCCQIVCIGIPALFGTPVIVTPLQFMLTNMLQCTLFAVALGRTKPQQVKKDAVAFTLLDASKDVLCGTCAGGAAASAFMWWFMTIGFEWSELLSSAKCADAANWKCTTLSNPIEARSLALAVCTVLDIVSGFQALNKNGSIAFMRPLTNTSLFFSSVIYFSVLVVLPQFTCFSSVLLTDPVRVQSVKLVSQLNTVEFCQTLLMFAFPLIFAEEFIKLVSIIWQH